VGQRVPEMKMPKLSLALFTRRTGGIDVAKYNLLRQTFKDFEFILIDELYEKRHEAVEKYFKGSGIDLVHVNASKEHHRRWKPWDYTVCRSMNLALVYARGELLVFNGDYWVMSKRALEAVWKAWEKWGKQGITFLLTPHCKIYTKVKPSFISYAKKNRPTWNKQGGSHNLDAPPETYISIYTREFSETPRIGPGNVDRRIPSAGVYNDMRDPSPNDPPDLKRYHAGEIGDFKYWITGPAVGYGTTVPVKEAVAVNGWNYILCPNWGGWEEIDIRMARAFPLRYLCTTSAYGYNLPHDHLWGRDSPRHLRGSNREMGTLKIIQKKKLEGHYWADNPFNIAEERNKLREKGITDIFNY